MRLSCGRYGMSSIYPLVMSWPTQAGFHLDSHSTTHLVIGGCIGESVVPAIFGALMSVRIFLQLASSGTRTSSREFVNTRPTHVKCGGCKQHRRNRV
jgi:hypothetical protein